LGCNNGVCGACKVIVEKTAVASCRVLAYQVDGKRITTIEGLSENGRLHPLQEAFISFGAFQCGFCVPGMIMEAKAFLDKNPNPTVVDVRRAISHNICRCGSYANQIAAIMAAAETMRSERAHE
jgi:carbon-monoxide dehydrogenase small subunit